MASEADGIQIDRLGKTIGYGYLMTLVEQAWRKHLESRGYPSGGELSVGPCVAMLVPCLHQETDANGHCQICCGSGRVTRWTADVAASRADTPKAVTLPPLPHHTNTEKRDFVYGVDPRFTYAEVAMALADRNEQLVNSLEGLANTTAELLRLRERFVSNENLVSAIRELAGALEDNTFSGVQDRVECILQAPKQ